MKEIIFASHNKGKIAEINTLLGPSFKVLGLNDIQFHEETEETGNTFEENAKLKADAVFKFIGKNCFADDSGLTIDALNGQPGVKSARYASEKASNEENISKVLEELIGKTPATARFSTCICLIWNGETFYFEGKAEGEIIEEKRGSNGFGYDSIFRPQNHERTFGEMSAEEKNQISHRKKAIQKMIDFLKEKSKP